MGSADVAKEIEDDLSAEVFLAHRWADALPVR